MWELVERAGTEVDWRAAAHPADLREYDAFGPWIDEVHSVEQMPRRYRSFFDEHRSARFLLKVPVDVDRVDARPGMDLYAAVLAVHDAGVCLLQQDGDTVLRRDATWDQVVGTSIHTNLLAARWSLLLWDGSTIEFDHNTASMAALERVNRFIRTLPVPDWAARCQPDPMPVAVPDHLFRGRLAALRREFGDAVVPIHFEERNRLCRDARSKRRLTNGVLLVDTPSNLVIVDRGEPAKSWFAPNYAVRTTVVPYHAVSDFSVVPATRPGRFHSLAITSGRQVVRQDCLDLPLAAVAALTARGIPQR